jgi:hypothetical protein
LKIKLRIINKNYFMSLTVGCIAIKGQHLEKLSELFSFFRLIDTNQDEIIDNWNLATDIIENESTNLNNFSQRKVAWYDNEWTIIEDYSFILCFDEDSLCKISKEFSTPVFSFITQGTSHSFGFWYFDQEKKRSFYLDGNNVSDNFGTPLLQEANFNINENCFYDDVIGIAKKLGIDWENAQYIKHFVVKTFGYNDELKKEMENFVQQQPDYKTISKPWWKFW